MLDASGSRRKKLRLTDLISLGDFLKIIDIVKVAIGLPGDNGFRRQWVVFLVVTVEVLGKNALIFSNSKEEEVDSEYKIEEKNESFLSTLGTETRSPTTELEDKDYDQ
ncbi:unnamed protein product [Lactuca saligna]|uniref:Uncharacterized protein n=1 Tax=Lactuca saligna TaxID=75948 RepID=A0AA35YB88_LACSI|nr:unnamed protein product [Lactuca saligna]